MFDAYFSPPYLRPSDAENMSSFGVRSCLLAIPTAHVAPSNVQGCVDLYTAGIDTHPAERRAHARHILEQAGIRCHIADAISPHLEPERSWGAQWNALTHAAFEGDIDALGMLVLHHGNYRGLEIIDRHLALSKATGLPVLVKSPEELPQHWARALHRRAAANASRWYWVHASMPSAFEALRRGEGVIMAPCRRNSAESIMRLAASLTPTEQRRMAIGSSRGRGLNPFALAGCEIAADTYAFAQHTPLGVLQGGALARPLHRALPAQWAEKQAL